MAVTRVGILTRRFFFGLALAGLAWGQPWGPDASGIRTAQAEDGAPPPRDGEVLRIPGRPGLRLPPGVHVYGPGQSDDHGIGNLYGNRRRSPDSGAESPSIDSRMFGRPFGHPGNEAKRKPPPKPPTAAERAAQIRKALAPRPPLAFVRRHTLDDLFGKLAAAKDADEAKGIAAVITGVWMRSGSDTSDLVMQRALQALEKKQFKVALDLLDHLVELRPGWAEAWNKRASVRFFTGDLNGAMLDVERVLKIEPKHFGALAGMASILHHTGFDKRALEVYRRSLEIYPHQPEIEKIADKLRLEVEGQGI